MRQNVRFIFWPIARVVLLQLQRGSTELKRRVQPAQGLHLPGIIARALAVLAIAMQVLVATAHLAGDAVRSFGGAETYANFAFLEICTGHGIEIINPASSAPSTGGTAACPVCTSACAFGFDQPLPAGEAVPVAFAVVDLVAPPVLALPADLRRLTDGPIRAPPLPLA